MSGLKELRGRIDSVRSTRKITSAMKMVAAAKLRRAQEEAESARPYAIRLSRLLRCLALDSSTHRGSCKLLVGRGVRKRQLFVVVTTDRGLCGTLRANVVREAQRSMSERESKGADVRFLCVGRKGRDLLRRGFAHKIVETFSTASKPTSASVVAQRITDWLVERFDADAFDMCVIFYAHFKSVLSQVVTVHPLIPVLPGDFESDAASGRRRDEGLRSVAVYEPDAQTLLESLSLRNLRAQVLRALLESNASEQGARMTAMDNATRNAEEMIDRLRLQYNRTRQASITRELIEIVSAKEAM